jgi:hypothetical protein
VLDPVQNDLVRWIAIGRLWSCASEWGGDGAAAAACGGAGRRARRRGVELALRCTVRPTVRTKAMLAARGSHLAKSGRLKRGGDHVQRGGVATSGGASSASRSRQVRARGRLQAVPMAPLPCDRGTGVVARRPEVAVAQVNGGGAARERQRRCRLGFSDGERTEGGGGGFIGRRP